MIFKLGLFSLLIILFHVSCAMGSPVLEVDENISEDEFYSDNYTNPDSLEAHRIATDANDSEFSQIKINDEFKPRETVSPDGNFTVHMKAVSTGSDMGIEEYVINNTQTGRETVIPGVATMGYYAVAFSPDSKMYAAPKIISCDDGRNCQYVIDISSAETNELLHRELIPYYKEDTKYTPMEWDRSSVYEIYWSEDGSSIVYDILGADIDGGTYPTTLATNRLNVNYTELREMNGYVEPTAEFASDTNETAEEQFYTVPEEQQEENVSADESEAVAAPGFGLLAALVAMSILVVGRSLRRRSR